KDWSRTESKECPFRTGQGGLPPRPHRDRALRRAKAAFLERRPSPPPARLCLPSVLLPRPRDKASASELGLAPRLLGKAGVDDGNAIRPQLHSAVLDVFHGND